jgi:hypothetical protein
MKAYDTASFARSPGVAVSGLPYDPGNCFRGDDGSFTLHGVFAEFTHFFQERYAALPADRVAALGAFVSECMAPADDGPLGNAAGTCFVEDIAGEPCDRELSRHRTGEARRYWQAWGGRAQPVRRTRGAGG